MKKFLLGMISFLWIISLVSCREIPPEDTISYDTFGSSATAPISASEETASTTHHVASDETTPNITSAGNENPSVIWMSPPTVTEELDIEKNAVKITVTGDGTYYFPERNGSYVENFKYELFRNFSGYMQANPLPMETPVVTYYSLSSYMKAQRENRTLRIKSGDGQDTDYTFTLDIPSLISDEPITLQNEFLHAAMTDHFGGAYSERDLLSIERMYIYYGKKPLMSHDRMANFIQFFKTQDNTSIRYNEDRFFDTPLDETSIVIPENTLEDLTLFHALITLELSDSWEEGKKQEWEARKAHYKELAHFTSRGYTPTEDTWSGQ